MPNPPLSDAPHRPHRDLAEAARLRRFRLVTVTSHGRNGESALDQALEETFPASDPVSITISKIVRVESI